MKRGFLDLEVAMTFFLIIMVLATGYSVYRVWATGQSSSSSSNQWVEVCQSCLETMNRDVRYARLVRVSSDTLEIMLPKDKAVSFRIENGSLKRIVQNGETRVLAESLQTGFFCDNPRLPGLVSLVLLPTDQMSFPFFTSFTLRGSL